MTSERIISHVGTSNGRRDIMHIGLVKGIIEIQKASVDDGFWMMDMDTTILIITGRVAMVAS